MKAMTKEQIKEIFSKVPNKFFASPVMDVDGIAKALFDAMPEKEELSKDKLIKVLTQSAFHNLTYLSKSQADQIADAIIYNFSRSKEKDAEQALNESYEAGKCHAYKHILSLLPKEKEVRYPYIENKNYDEEQDTACRADGWNAALKQVEENVRKRLK